MREQSNKNNNKKDPFKYKRTYTSYILRSKSYYFFLSVHIGHLDRKFNHIITNDTKT